MAGIILVVAFLVFGNMRMGYPRFGTVQKRLDRLNGVTREFLSSVRVVRAFRAEEEEREKFEEVSLARANTAALRTMAVFSPFISLTVNFGIVLLWISGSKRIGEALHEIDIQIRSGETIGFIGSTGSGKTTFVNLIPRFYDAVKGTVRIDGCDIRQIDVKYLRKAVAPQKALLFSGTIRENLLWGREDAGEEELYRAAEIACADTFIRQSAQGYDTRLGQEGYRDMEPLRNL